MPGNGSAFCAAPVSRVTPRLRRLLYASAGRGLSYVCSLSPSRAPADAFHGVRKGAAGHPATQSPPSRARASQWISSPFGGYCRSGCLANSNSGGGAGHNCTSADNASEPGISSYQASFWSQSRRHSRRQQRARETRECRRKASTCRNPPCQPVCKRIRRETVPISAQSTAASHAGRRWGGALTDGRVTAPRHAVDIKLDGRAVLPRQCDRR